MPAAAAFGTDPSAPPPVSAGGRYFPALDGAMGLDACKTGSPQHAMVAGSGNGGIQTIDTASCMATA